jgi:hypothetical protein
LVAPPITLEAQGALDSDSDTFDDVDSIEDNLNINA